MKQIFVLVFMLNAYSSLAQFKWANPNEVPKQWILLNRDSLGYLIYDPCDGSTPYINIDSGFVSIYSQLEGPDKFAINQFTIGSDKKSFYVHATNEGSTLDLNAKVVDSKRKLVLWSFNCDKKGNHCERWVTTASEFLREFRIVRNPCDSEKIAEKVFLPVEF
ncbi:MAG: hypothetical protein ABIN36_19970 [Ferruginibacter sp.]